MRNLSSGPFRCQAGKEHARRADRAAAGQPLRGIILLGRGAGSDAKASGPPRQEDVGGE
ncbi:MAG: hypothetical protein JEY71_10280 [Sphaerochaeta sp.]|nr:hypothetical protein [Sphaerochaeta sp.]